MLTRPLIRRVRTAAAPRLRSVGPVLALFALMGGAAGTDAPAPPVVGAVELYAGDPRSGLGLRGFDPVSYHLAPEPVPGAAELDLLWGGAAWRFASEANRAAFARHPEVFAPRIGGHDAEAAARGLLAEASPELFTVIGGRLYLFRTAVGRARFLAEAVRLAGEAEARWPVLRRELVSP